MRPTLALAIVSVLVAGPVGATPSARIPTRIGGCSRTYITGTATRFGDPLNTTAENGTVVNYQNGGTQTSYDRVPEIVQSRVGDQVLMCLVKLPQGCPKGDVRGKIYTTTNLRTQGSWTLSDSQHMCGGA